MGLPDSRDLNYANDSLPAVDAGNLNRLQDLWVSLCKGASTLFSAYTSLKALVLDGTGGVNTSVSGTGDGLPAIYIPTAPTVRKLIFKQLIGTAIYLRKYALLNGGHETTLNAEWNPGTLQWSLDDGAKVAMSFRHVQTSTVATTYQLKKDAASGAWADGSWDEVFRADRLGGVYAVDFYGSGKLQLTGGSSSIELTGGGAYVITKRYVTTLQTTDATPANVISYTVPTNAVVRVTIKANGIRSDHAAGACYWKTFTMLNNAGTPSNVGGGNAAVVAEEEDDATWGGLGSTGFVGAVFSAQVTGKAATTIKWIAEIEIVAVVQ